MRGLITGLWIALIGLMIGFIYLNPDRVAVHFWPLLVLDTQLWALVIGALLVGFVPTTLVARATRWRLSRRIAALEATLAAQAHALTHAAEQASTADEIS